MFGRVECGAPLGHVRAVRGFSDAAAATQPPPITITVEDDDAGAHRSSILPAYAAALLRANPVLLPHANPASVLQRPTGCGRRSRRTLSTRERSSSSSRSTSSGERSAYCPSMLALAQPAIPARRTPGRFTDPSAGFVRVRRQSKAKRAVAVALRNRYRRHALPDDVSTRRTRHHDLISRDISERLLAFSAEGGGRTEEHPHDRPDR